jgi:hypothetical protein
MKEGTSSAMMVGQVVCDAFAMGSHATLEPKPMSLIGVALRRKREANQVEIKLVFEQIQTFHDAFVVDVA